MSSVESYLAANLNKFPSQELPSIKQRLQGLNESQFNYVLTANMKDPSTALILSILLGTLGVDRFYIGNTGLGILKLLFSWLTFGIWVIVDWFVIMKATRQANLEALNVALSLATSQDNYGTSQVQ